MRLRWMVNSLVIFLICGGWLLDIHRVPAASASSGEKIESSLLETLARQDQVDFIVRFVAQPDLSVAYGMDWQERGEYVIKALRETANKSQGRAKGLLDAAGMKYETFIAGNELYVWQGNLSAVTNLAELQEVESIRETRTYTITPVVRETHALLRIDWPGDLLANNQIAWVGESVTALTWGISFTNANDFWAQFGFQGDGIIVANIDTGVQWNHPGLDQAFRCGTNPADPRCWYDPEGTCGGIACDNNGHGTHTMGSMVSDNDPTLSYQAGMAPNAKWIACKGCKDTNCSDYALNACADWILNPGGSTANRPHVVNNSWGGEKGGGEIWFEPKVLAWRAAGIHPSFSAGNYGILGCQTLTSPGDYQISFASAAHDQIGKVADFSSRGPSYYGHEPYTKPNITAPGVNICSTWPNNTWQCNMSGTSMAAPHSSGAVALLWSCNSGLIGQVDATFQALQNTALKKVDSTCGFPPDGEGSYDYGYGLLNVFNAGTSYCTNVATGEVDGYVYDSVSGEPVDGAVVDAALTVMSDAEPDAITDPSGYYSMTLPIGSYTLTASKNGYEPKVVDLTITYGGLLHQDFALDWMGLWESGPEDPTDFMRYDCAWFDDGTGLSPYNMKVYCMGGRTGGATESGEIWRFDAATQEFTNTGDELYEDVSNYTANVVQDANGWAIYVIGGFDSDGTGTMVNYVQRYDPATGSVQLVSTDPVPLKIGGVQANPGACVSVQNRIYCFGGWESAVAPYVGGETWEFDPVRVPGSRWTRILTANLSVPRGYIQTAVQNDTIYAMGGISGVVVVDDVITDLVPTVTVESLNVNDLAAGWKKIASLPVATAEGRGFGFGADTIINTTQSWGDKLYVVGGGDFPAETTEVLEYDAASGTWNQDFPEIQLPRRLHAGVFIPLCSEDPTDGLPGMWILGGRNQDDEPPFLEPEFYPMPCSDPTPVVDLSVTVGLDPSECASTTRVDIDSPTEVTYCFNIYNNSPITMTQHDLEDSSLGILLDGYAYLLAPGESFYITETVTLDSTTFNLAGWTAYDGAGNTYMDYDYASVVYKDKYYLIVLPMNYKKY